MQYFWLGLGCAMFLFGLARKNHFVSLLWMGAGFLLATANV